MFLWFIFCSFNTIQDVIELKRQDMYDNRTLCFNTIQDVIELKLIQYIFGAFGCFNTIQDVIELKRHNTT